MPDVVYLEDLTGKPIQGGVYPEEVQRVEWNGEKRPKDVFKTRKRKDGIVESLVNFHYFPPSHKEWVVDVS